MVGDLDDDDVQDQDDDDCDDDDCGGDDDDYDDYNDDDDDDYKVITFQTSGDRSLLVMEKEGGLEVWTIGTSVV